MIRLLLLNFLLISSTYSFSIEEIRSDWHQFLPTHQIPFSTDKPVVVTQVSAGIASYEPEIYDKTIIWVTGNAFILNEPHSHDYFLKAFAEKTKSKIYALSHQKMPEGSFTGILQDIRYSIEFLQENGYLNEGTPLMLAGDSSGAFIIPRLKLEKPFFDQYLFIAPIFDLEPLPEPMNDEAVLQQASLMKTIALFFNADSSFEKSDDWMASFPKESHAKVHLIAFQRDLFYEQAALLAESIPGATIESIPGKKHGDYLLFSDEDEPPKSFLFSIGLIFDESR